jgi:hypothetical protein
MKRIMLIAAALALLALPVIAGADETVIPPEAKWTPTPPARTVIDAEKLTDLLVKKGVLTPLERAQIKQPAAAGSASDYREMDRSNGLSVLSQP